MKTTRYITLLAICIAATCACTDIDTVEEEFFKKNEVAFEPVTDDSDIYTPDATPETGTCIKLDGDFSDWAQEGVVASSAALEGADAIKEVKACLSSKYIYVYYKSDKRSALNNVRVVIDCDDNAETGDSYGPFPETGFSMMFNITSPDAPVGAPAYSMILGGESLIDGLTDFSNGKAVIDGDSIEAEMSFDRKKIEAVEAFSGKGLRVQLYALDFSWGLSSVIPSDAPLHITIQ